MKPLCHNVSSKPVSFSLSSHAQARLSETVLKKVFTVFVFLKGQFRNQNTYFFLPFSFLFLSGLSWCELMNLSRTL